MTGIEKSLELYELFYKRTSNCKFSPNQAQYYKECLELFRECETAEEATVKMKNSPLYTKGGQAVSLDKLYAQQKAAEELDYHELAEIYKNQYDKVKEDYNNAWNTAYTGKVSSFLMKIENLKSSFYEIFNDYVTLKTNSSKETRYKFSFKNLGEKYKTIENNGETFKGLSEQERYRRLIHINDKGYQEFIDFVEKFMSTGELEDNITNVDVSSEWNNIKKHKAEITSIGQREFSKLKRVSCISVPPKDTKGTYTYIDFEEEAY